MFDERFLEAQRQIAANHGETKKIEKKASLTCVDYRLNDYAERIKALLQPLFPLSAPAGLLAERGSGVPCLMGATLELLDPDQIVVVTHEDCAALANARSKPGGLFADLFRIYGLEPGDSDLDYAIRHLKRVQKTMKPGVQIVGIFAQVNGDPLIFRDGEYVPYRAGEPLF